ncbi:hypothetical protein ABG067_002223 [Albugo candida]
MVHKYLLVGLTPLVSLVPISGNFVKEVEQFSAGEVILPVLDTLKDDGRKFCLFFDFDKTIIKKNLPDIVRDKQIEEGLFGFGPDMVQDVFGFQSVPTSRDCILENELFSNKVQEIYRFFLKHQRELNSPHAKLSHEEQEKLKGLFKAWDTLVFKVIKYKGEENNKRCSYLLLTKDYSHEEQEKLKGLFEAWDTLVFKVINYKGEENNKRCSYLLLTKNYRLLFGLEENIRNKLIADAFDVPGSSHLSPEHLIAMKQKQFAYPKMLEFIKVLREKNAKSFIITATHYAYLDPTLKALGIEDQFTGVYGTSPTNDLWNNVLTGNGHSMSGIGKANQVQEIKRVEKCTAIFAVGDSIYDYQMLEIVLKEKGYGLVISTKQGEPQKGQLEYIVKRYPKVAIQRVNDEDWISTYNS